MGHGTYKALMYPHAEVCRGFTGGEFEAAHADEDWCGVLVGQGYVSCLVSRCGSVTSLTDIHCARAGARRSSIARPERKGS